MAPIVSEKCDLYLYDVVTKRADVLSNMLLAYPDLWKTDKDTLTLPEKPGREILTGIIGEQSSGKSTLLNSICCYPILPAASVITSERPVEIRKSDKDYIQIQWTEDDRLRTIDFSMVRLDEAFVRSLLEYSIKCCNNNIITCDNLNYLTTKPIPSARAAVDLKPEDFDLFDPNDQRQIMMLLMMLLGSHVGTRGIHTESDIREEIKSQYRKLMSKLGMDGEREFTVQLYWNSPLLCEGNVLMDLPGLRDTAGRSAVTLHQLHQLDSAVLLFSPHQEEPDLYQFAKDFLQDGKPTPAPGSFSRITAVLNKADLCPQNLEKILSEIRKKCGFPENFPVYPICAANGEFLYTELGGMDPRATFLCKSHPGWTREESTMALYEAFCRPYQSVLLHKTQQIITEELTNRIRDLTSLNWLNNAADEFEDIKRRINLHRSFLVCLEKCGSRFTKSFYEALSLAYSEAQEAFHSEFQTAARHLLDNMLAAEDFREVESAFRGGLKQMESDILQTAETYFHRMKRKNFRISLDDDHNKAIFLEFYHWLGGISDSQNGGLHVSDYLQSGIRRLEQTLDFQHQIYRDGIEELARKYLEFPCIFDHAFESASEQAEISLLSEYPTLAQEDLASYREQSVILQKTVSNYLTETVHSRILMLRSDRTIAREFSVTAELIREYQQILESFYCKKCPEMLLQCRKIPLFQDTVYLSPRQFRGQFRNSFYAAGAINDFLKAIETLLTEDPNREPSEGSSGPIQWVSRLHRIFRCRNTHPRRVRLAIEGMSRQFCTYTGKDLRRFSGQMKKQAKSMMNSEKNVYVSEKKLFSELNSRLLSELNAMKAELLPLIHQMMQKESLSSDAAALIKRLNDL